MPDWRPYAGRWVALVAGRVAGSGRSPSKARQMALRNRPKDRPTIAFVRPGEGNTIVTELVLGPILPTIRPLLSNAPPVYVVGGAVRDALLGRISHDLDFAVDGNAVQLARSIADALKGAFYLLDAARGTARVILNHHPSLAQNELIELDFACLRGDSLDEDLHDRDFTINTLALPADLTTPTVKDIIDPLGGQTDLSAQLVRAAGPQAIIKDPIRGLRAVRQAAQLGFDIEPQTQELIQAAADQLSTISAERIRDELGRTLAAPRPDQSLRTLDRLDLLEHVLPELSRTHHVTQSPPHQLDVFEHTMLVLEGLEQVLGVLGSSEPAPGSLVLAQELLSPFAAQLEAHLDRPTAGGRTGRMLLFLGALMHDVGKPETRTVEESGRIRFLTHEKVGARLAGQRARKLALSSAEVRQVRAMVQHHMRPAFLAKSAFPPSRRAIYRFFRDAQANGVDICLLCLADGLGKGEEPAAEDWERRVRTVAVLLHHYYNRNQETVAPPPLLGGMDLIEALNIPPGPEVGRLLRLIQEAQAAGEVSTVAGALDLARREYGTEKRDESRNRVDN